MAGDHSGPSLSERRSWSVRIWESRSQSTCRCWGAFWIALSGREFGSLLLQLSTSCHSAKVRSSAMLRRGIDTPRQVACSSPMPWPLVWNGSTEINFVSRDVEHPRVKGLYLPANGTLGLNGEIVGQPPGKLSAVSPAPVATSWLAWPVVLELPAPCLHRRASCRGPDAIGPGFPARPEPNLPWAFPRAGGGLLYPR